MTDSYNNATTSKQLPFPSCIHNKLEIKTHLRTGLIHVKKIHLDGVR